MSRPHFAEEYIEALLPGRLVCFICGVLVAAAASLFVKSSECHTAREVAAEQTANVMELKRENKILEPLALEAMGLRSAQYQRIAHRLAVFLDSAGRRDSGTVYRVRR